MLKVLVDTQPLGTGHAARGIGGYTRNLVEELSKDPELVVYRSSLLEVGEKPQVDLIHYPFFDLFFSTLPILQHIPTIVTVHDVIPLKFPEFYPAGIKGTLRFQKQKLALQRAAAVITDSENSKNDISELLTIAPEKIHVVYLAAQPQLSFQPESVCEQVRKKYALPQNYVLYVGDINYNKNIPQLIKMLKFLPEEISLVCVGKHFKPQPIPEWNWIEQQLALSDVATRVHFVTDILVEATTELSALYSGALCYVQPSLYEGFGLPLLEAMRCRTVVVSSNTSSLPEVGGAHVLFTDPEAEALALKVKEVISWSKSKREKYITAAHKWQKQFSWQKTAAATKAVYKSVVAL